MRSWTVTANVNVLMLLLTASAAAAREYAPRVISPDRADAYSMRTFAAFPHWHNLKDDALAWAVYQYLADTHSGLFHCNEVLEGDDTLSEYRNVRDPVKIINVYGYAYCGILGPTMAGIWEDMTGNRARTVTLPAWAHVVSEVFYAGRWHYMDIDVRAVFRRPDGTLASLDEARHDPSLWRDRGPLFFPHDSLDSTRKIYEQTPVENYHGFNQSGHTMDYLLRQGETFTRWWTPQGGRWNHRLEWNREEWLRRLIEVAAPWSQAQSPRLHDPQPRQRQVRLPAQPHRPVLGLRRRRVRFAERATCCRRVEPDGAGRGLCNLRGPLALRYRPESGAAGHIGRGLRGIAGRLGRQRRRAGPVGR